MNSSGASMTSCSMGSWRMPSMERVRTCGLPTAISCPPLDTSHGHDVAGSGLCNLDPAQALVPIEPGDFGEHHLAVEAAEGDFLPLREAAVEDPAHGQAAHAIIVAHGGHQTQP